MRHRERVQKLIQNKLLEIQTLEQRIVITRAFVGGLQESLKYMPKGEGEQDSDSNMGGREPREGSVVAQVRDYLREVGRPLHISEILKGIGKTNDPRTRASVAGSVSSYARMDVVFVKAGANMFGLKEFRAEPESELPQSFGRHLPKSEAS